MDRIDPNHTFVTELGSVGCITWPQRDHIINIVILLKSSAQAQKHEVSYDGVEDVTRACHLDLMIEANCLSVEPDFGLLDHLLSLHVLTPSTSFDGVE